MISILQIRFSVYNYYQNKTHIYGGCIENKKIINFDLNNWILIIAQKNLNLNSKVYAFLKLVTL